MGSLNLLTENCVKINLDVMQSETENVFSVSGDNHDWHNFVKNKKNCEKNWFKINKLILLLFRDWYSEKHKCRLDFLMRKIFIDEREIIFKKNKKLEKEYKKRKNKNQRKPWSFTGILFKKINTEQ